ncbi:MAG: sulfotransferase family 2 domain-containing protein [Pseudomonadota bacterium]
MIVSHKHRFIFIKTHKTAGSSLEVALARECGPQDIVSHMEDNLASGLPRNYGPTSALGSLYNRHKLVRKLIDRHSPMLGAFYYEHMPATRVRELVGDDVWRSYYKFCFERNPWDKVVSYYLWKKEGQGKHQPEFERYVTTKSHRLPVDSRLYFDDDRMLVDQVFEFRELSTALAALRSKLGLALPEPLPREKTGLATQREPYTSFYSEETKALVAQLFAREIKLMGYHF